MAGRLKNRTALVTGANRGIGLAIAQEYAGEGANVLLAGRNEAALEQIRDRIVSQGGKAQVFVVDLEKEESVREMARAIKEKVQALDILVGNGASLGARVPLIKYPLDTWRQTFRINVEANLILLAELDELLRRSDAPRVIMLSANVATQGKATTGSYAVSKAALEAIVRIYVAEAGQSPVRINIISPGATRTEMRARAAPEEDPMTLKTPEDIAPLFVEMAAPEYREQGKWVNADDWLAKRAKAKA
jgi:NAD(P)-dependent dehydrogenase (short-subunit alcohol dehydrogenase family)